MNLDDLDAEVDRLYGLANANTSRPPSAYALAVALLGVDNIRRGNTDGEAAKMDHDAGVLWAARRANGALRSFSIAHEIAEWWLRKLGGIPKDRLEPLSDALAIRLLAPTDAFRGAVRIWGLDAAKLSDEFSITQSSVVLRLGEVLRKPVAVLTPTHTYFGIIPHQLDLFIDVTRTQVLDGRSVRGMRRIAITDARRRVGLVAE